MSTPPQLIPLMPTEVSPNDRQYQDLLTWPFPTTPFYVGQVVRLLTSDIPQRVVYGTGMVWVFRDAANNVVGFGALDICKEYSQWTGGKHHVYIPVLAVHPHFQRQGHGRTILAHLLQESRLIVSQNAAHCSDDVFLDVYSKNSDAISLYQKCGFVVLNATAPIPDSQENNETYVIMAKKLAVSGSAPTP